MNQKEIILKTLEEKTSFCKLVLKEGNYPEIQIAQLQGMCELAKIIGIEETLIKEITKNVMH